jgi:hypothetical protein
MAVTTGENVWTDGATSRPPLLATRPPGAVKLWALLGAIAIAVIVTGFARWIFSDDFVAAPKGSDHYGRLSTLRVVEVISALFLVYFFVSCVVRPLVRRRRFEFDGMLLIGCLAVNFIDPVFNYFSPTFLQNSYSVNRGSWANFIPGYASPSGHAHYVEGVLWAAALYGLFGIAAAQIGCWLLGRLRRRFPMLSNLSLYSMLFVVFAIADLAIENFFVRSQIYVFWGAWSPLTLWAGKLYQFPVYETILAVVYALGFVWLRDARDDRGRAWVERGVDRLRIGRHLRTAASFCAITGFSLVWAIASYFGAYMFLSMKADAFPKLPSYLQAGAFCGQAGDPLCPSQYLKRLRDSVAPGARR